MSDTARATPGITLWLMLPNMDSTEVDWLRIGTMPLVVLLLDFAKAARLVFMQAEDLSGLLLFPEVPKAQLSHVVAAPGMHCCVRDRHHVLAARRNPSHSLTCRNE